MDKHQILKAYYNYKKELLNVEKKTNVQVPKRKYITLVSDSKRNEETEEFSLEGFSKRKYIKIYPKAD